MPKHIPIHTRFKLSLFRCALLVWLSYAPVLNASTSASPIAKPSVASINLCTDQLVLLLAEHEQILSLSNLSHDKSGSYLYKEAASYPVTKGESEAILAMQPDVILAGQYTTKQTVKLLRELGFRVELVPIANTLNQLYDNIINVATWVGDVEKGERMVSAMQQRVSRLGAKLAEDVRVNPSAAFYDPNGYTVGDKTLRGQVLKLSGWTNVATQWGIEHYGTLSLESMVTLAPDAVIDSPYSVGTYSRGQQLLKHPALHAQGLDTVVIGIPSRQTICAGPWTVDMIELLSEKRSDLLHANDGAD